MNVYRPFDVTDLADRRVLVRQGWRLLLWFARMLKGHGLPRPAPVAMTMMLHELNWHWQRAGYKLDPFVDVAGDARNIGIPCTWQDSKGRRIEA